MFRGHRTVTGIIVAAALCAVASPAYAQSPPSNDNYLSSTVIPAASTTGLSSATFSDTQDLTGATTQTDLFNPDQHGVPFAGAGPEPLTCNGSSYGHTIWYDLHPQVPEGVELQTAGLPNAIAVYQWDTATSKIVRLVGCQVTTGIAPNDLILPFELQKGKAYTVQIGGLQTAAGLAAGPLSFNATVFPDHDGDGVYDSLDACPSLAGIPRFGGCPPTISPGLIYAYRTVGGGLGLTRFQVGGIVGGARVEARCSCGVHQVLTAGGRATSLTMNGFVGRTIPSGATVEVWVTKRAAGHGTYRHGAIGGYLKYGAKLTGLGLPTKRCLMPGSRSPQRQCPAGGRRHA